MTAIDAQIDQMDQTHVTQLIQWYEQWFDHCFKAWTIISAKLNSNLTRIGQGAQAFNKNDQRALMQELLAWKSNLESNDDILKWAFNMEYSYISVAAPTLDNQLNPPEFLSWLSDQWSKWAIQAYETVVEVETRLGQYKISKDGLLRNSPPRDTLSILKRYAHYCADQKRYLEADAAMQKWLQHLHPHYHNPAQQADYDRRHKPTRTVTPKSGMATVVETLSDEQLGGLLQWYGSWFGHCFASWTHIMGELGRHGDAWDAAHKGHDLAAKQTAVREAVAWKASLESHPDVIEWAGGMTYSGKSTASTTSTITIDPATHPTSADDLDGFLNWFLHQWLPAAIRVNSAIEALKILAVQEGTGPDQLQLVPTVMKSQIGPQTHELPQAIRNVYNRMAHIVIDNKTHLETDPHMQLFLEHLYPQQSHQLQPSHH